jgi:hypothetical protein
VKHILFFIAGSALAFGQSLPQTISENRIPARPIDQAQARQGLEQKARKAAERLRKRALRALADQPAPVFGSLLTQTMREPISWTLAPSDCALVKSKLTANGTIKMVLTVQPNSDGTYNYEENDEASGMVTDDAGKNYIFLYHITLLVDSNTTLPEPLPPLQTYGPDEFRLIPVDGGAGYNINLYFNFGVDAGGNMKDLGSLFSNDPNCDPI